jgi:glycosyltransferase involved in cell wall biosynthesis
MEDSDRREATIAAVVPTHGRAQILPRCLEGLARQRRPPDEVILVIREGDRLTAEVAETWSRKLPLRVVMVGEPGLVPALNAGLAAAEADLVAFTDDDAVPRDAWLSGIEATFGDPAVAGAGGRDVVWRDGRMISEREDLAARLTPVGSRDPVVGRVQRFGRITGNHHLGSGPPRDVDVLKGANMAYRRALAAPLGFDLRLRGSGLEHSEPSLCLPLRAAGWRIVYDPAIVVDHFLAPRARGDDRELLDPARVYDATFNEALSLWPFLKRRWYAPHVAWAVLVGTIGSPGVMQLPRHARRGSRRPWRLMTAALKARYDALGVSRTGEPRVATPRAAAAHRRPPHA